jgi:hypothetical protein
MKDSNGKISPENHAKMAEFVRIGQNAVRKAREESRRLGLPNVDGRDGKLIFEMPDGEIVIKDISKDNEN